MSKYVFFSTIGKSDPIRGNYDGPFLHILRHYKPAKTYLFLTKEMCEYHEKDNRYIILGKRICPDCEFIPLKYPDFDKPHNYEISEKLMTEALDKVCQENPDDQIIVNITSSTSQMTNALYIYAATSKKKLKLIQVVTHAKAGNDTEPVGWNFDIEYEWANLCDNLTDMPDIENRCREITPNNVRYKIASETIMSHIKHYDYYPALTISKSLESLFDKKVIYMLEAAAQRIELEYDKAEDFSRKAGYSFETIGNMRDSRDIFEFLLYLKCKMDRGELSEFARGISPVLTRLFKSYLKQVHNFDITSLCDWVKDKKLYKIKRSKITSEDMLKVYDSYFEPSFNDRELAFSNILPAVEYFCIKDKKYFDDLNRANELRQFERNIRNSAAHQITAITGEILQNDFGTSAEKIFRHLRYIFTRTYGNFSKNIPWDSYDKMNEYITGLLE